MAVVLGSSGNDRIIPDDLSAAVIVSVGDFTTGDENDQIAGLGGNDRIAAGSAIDTIYGDLDAVQGATDKAGNDRIDGQGGNDTLVGDSLGLSAGAKGGNDLLYGGADEDHLYGDALGDLTDARGGNDTIDGGSGFDWLYGDGNVLAGGKGGADRIAAGDGNDRVYGDAETLRGGAQGGDDRLEGGNGDDRIWGDAATFADEASIGGKDRLDGGNGDDWLDGGRGDDQLTGGAGEDSFVIGLRGGDDVILDFDDDEDVVDLSALFDASGKTVLAVFGADGRLDDGDEHVRDSIKGLEIDLGRIFGTSEAGLDTLTIRGTDNLNLDQVLTSAVV